MKTSTVFIVLAILLQTLSFSQSTITKNNGILTNTSVTDIDFLDQDPRTRSIALATIPMLSTGATAIVFELNGGDGGIATWDGAATDLVAEGGEGGKVLFTLPITTANEGRQLTIYRGKEGESDIGTINATGGGGGSSAILDHNETILAVASGGGGAYASEPVTSSGIGGSSNATDGNSSCGNEGEAGIVGSISNSSGTVTLLNVGNVVNQEFTSINVYAGGGGGIAGVRTYTNPAVHLFEISGKSAEFGGFGGIRPVATISRGENCDSNNPFGIGCITFTTVDKSAGGAGFSGGGAGGMYLEGNGINCLAQFGEGLRGGGGGGAGYYGGGGGDEERGGGGGSSFAHSSVQDVLFTHGNTTNNPRNGFVNYFVIYDSENPEAICQNTTITLGVGLFFNNSGEFEVGEGTRGEATLNPTDIDGGSTDDGFIVSYEPSPSVFDCTNLGANTVTLTVADGSGNTDSCTAQVTVIDTHAPTITGATRNIITANDFGVIDLEDNAQLTVNPPNLTFEDNCAVASVTPFEPFTVFCEDIGQEFVKEFVVEDTSGNTRSLFLTYTVTSSTIPTEVIYVNASRPDDTGDGLSWSTAKRTLTAALDLIDPNTCNNNRQIWVAGGTYYPDEGAGQINDDRTSTFLLKEVEIFGGFVGNEIAIAQRNLANNPTILSGDLMQNDTSDPATRADNAYHVVVAFQLSTIATLDGFIIERGNADGSLSTLQNIGSGLYIISSNFNLSNSWIRGNIADIAGAGITNFIGSPTLTNVLISGNTVTDSNSIGGGIYNDSNNPMTLVNCTISGNKAAENGGGIYNENNSNVKVFNSIIWNNEVAGSTVTVSASVFDEGSNTTQYANSLVANIADSGVILNEDPNFEQGINLSSVTLPSTQGDFHFNSANLLNTGNETFNQSITDLEGTSRILGNGIDIGAYEANIFELTSTSPVNNRINFNQGQNIGLNFSEAPLASTFTTQNIKINTPYGPPVGFTPTDIVGNITGLDPSRDFYPGEQVSITVNKNVRSVVGSFLENGSVLNFTAAVNPNSPGVFSVNPSNIALSSTNSEGVVNSADLDGDGKLDVFYTSRIGDFIAWRQNDGTGNFSEAQIIDNNINDPRAIIAADVNNDGTMDVLSTSGIEKEVYWHENNGSGTFVRHLIATIGSVRFTDLKVADVDADGNLDVIAIGDLTSIANRATLFVYINDGNGNFTEEYSNTIPTNGGLLEIADIDNDGLQDFVITGTRKMFSLQNNGQGSFNEEVLIYEESSTIIGFSSLKLADVDGNNSMDIILGTSSVFASNTGYLGLFKNDGTGNFDPIEIIQEPAQNIRSLATSDFDGDGDLDILTASSFDNKVSWFENDGNGTFGLPTEISSSLDRPTNVTTSDLDNDGDLDVIVSSIGDNRIDWFSNGSILGISCPENLEFDFGVDCSYTYPDFTQDAMITANTGINFTVTQDPAPGTVTFGLPSVTLTITDNDTGESESCSFNISVRDNTPPTALANDITLQLNSNGSIFLDPTQVNDGSSDNCSLEMIYVNPSTFTCENIGENDILFIAEDAAGNLASKNITVTIVDNQTPEFDNTTVPLSQVIREVNDNNEYILEDFTTGVIGIDNCEDTLTITQSPAINTVLTTNTYDITLTAADTSGNSVDYVFELIVEDNALGLGNLNILNKILLYPNPASNTVTILNEQNVALDTVQIYDTIGRLINTIKVNNLNVKTDINVTNLNSGNYFVVITGNGVKITKRFIKN